MPEAQTSDPQLLEMALDLLASARITKFGHYEI